MTNSLHFTLNLRSTQISWITQAKEHIFYIMVNFRTIVQGEGAAFLTYIPNYAFTSFSSHLYPWFLSFLASWMTYAWWWQFQQLSCAQLFATSWTVAPQVPLPMGFSRQEYWSGQPFTSPGDLPGPGIKPASPAQQGDSLSLSLHSKAQ